MLHVLNPLKSTFLTFESGLVTTHTQSDQDTNTTTEVKKKMRKEQNNTKPGLRSCGIKPASSYVCAHFVI